MPVGHQLLCLEPTNSRQHACIASEIAALWLLSCAYLSHFWCLRSSQMDPVTCTIGFCWSRAFWQYIICPGLVEGVQRYSLNDVGIWVELSLKKSAEKAPKKRPNGHPEGWECDISTKSYPNHMIQVVADSRRLCESRSILSAQIG